MSAGALPPPRVVVYGPECTGKTTLARAIAAHLGAPCSPEFVRGWVEEAGRSPAAADFEAIVRGQLDLEAIAVRQAIADRARLVVHDTDVHTNCVYGRHYNGAIPPWTEAAARAQPYALHLLCAVDLPWQPDGPQRDRPEGRDEMFSAFREELDRTGRQYEIVRGSGEARTASAITAIERLIANSRP